MELTIDGMTLLTAGQGLSLGRAIACHGLTGGGPREPVGATMWARGYEHKLNAYYEYWKAQRLYRNREHFSTVLVVTVSDAAEERIARVARDVARWEWTPLPMLLTCQWRADEEHNCPGPLGPIWRTPNADIEDRHYWLPVTPL